MSAFLRVPMELSSERYGTEHDYAKRCMRQSLRRSSAIGLASLLSPAGRRGRLVVFSYHQVLENRDALRPGEPNQEDFASDVAIISRVFTVISLADAAQRLDAGTLPARAACITFDDGYANNHALAAPVLEAAGTPATFFVTSGAVDDGVMWNDLVIEAIARCRGIFRVPDAVSLDSQKYSSLQGAALVDAIIGALKYKPLSERRAAAERIFRANVDGDPPRLMMTRAMVADLARRGFDIGGHTANHPILKELPDDEARHEIEFCSRWIEAVTGVRPKSFAYPNGRPGVDFLPVHAAMAAAAGYRVAVSTSWDVARAGSDVFSIPRVGPWWRQGRTVPSGLLRVYARSYMQPR